MANIKPLVDLGRRALGSEAARQFGRSVASEGSRIAKDVAIPALKREIQKGVLSALESRTAPAALGPRNRTDFSALARPSQASGGAKPEPEVVMTERPQIEPQPSSPGSIPSLREQLKAGAKSGLQQAAQAAFKAASGVASDGAQQAHAALMGKLGLPADAKPHQMLGLSRPPIAPKDLEPLLRNLFRRVIDATKRKSGGSGRAQQAADRVKRVIDLVQQHAGGQLEQARRTQASLEAKFAHLPSTGPQVRAVLGEAMQQLAGMVGEVQAMLEAAAQRMAAASQPQAPTPTQAEPSKPARSDAELATMKRMGLAADASDHDILGVAADADAASIRKSYRGAMLKYHPDKHAGFEDEAKLVIGAYERLTNKPAAEAEDKSVDA